MSQTNRLSLLRAVVGLALAIASASAWASTAGQFLWVTGDVAVRAATGAERTVSRGDSLSEGETIRTGASGLAQVRLTDGGILSLRANTEMRLDKFSYGGPTDTIASMIIALARGGFRSVTGMVGKVNPRGYVINTPTATLGIRGTDHEPYFIPQPQPGELPIGAPGTYDRVHEGRTFIRTAQGEVELRAGQTGFAELDGGPPSALPAAPLFYRPPASLPPRTNAPVAPQLTAVPSAAGQVTVEPIAGESKASTSSSGGAPSTRGNVSSNTSSAHPSGRAPVTSNAGAMPPETRGAMPTFPPPSWSPLHSPIHRP